MQKTAKSLLDVPGQDSRKQGLVLSVCDSGVQGLRFKRLQVEGLRLWD